MIVNEFVGRLSNTKWISSWDFANSGKASHDKNKTICNNLSGFFLNVGANLARALSPSRPLVEEEDANPSVDSTFVLQSVTCQPVLQVVKEFWGDSAPGREEIGPVFLKYNLDVLLLPLWHIKKQILD